MVLRKCPILRLHSVDFFPQQLEKSLEESESEVKKVMGDYKSIIAQKGDAEKSVRDKDDLIADLRFVPFSPTLRRNQFDEKQQCPGRELINSNFPMLSTHFSVAKWRLSRRPSTNKRRPSPS